MRGLNGPRISLTDNAGWLGSGALLCIAMAAKSAWAAVEKKLEVLSCEQTFCPTCVFTETQSVDGTARGATYPGGAVMKSHVVAIAAIAGSLFLAPAMIEHANAGPH